MAFPQTRMRRMRSSPTLRGLVRETELRVGQLVLPLFVSESTNDDPASSGREPIAAMPGVERLSIAAAVHEADEAARLGLAAVLLFGIPAEKDAYGSAAWDDEGVVQVCTRAIKQAHPELLVITDVCLCEYTEHGHCGVLETETSPVRADNEHSPHVGKGLGNGHPLRVGNGLGNEHSPHVDNEHAPCVDNEHSPRVDNDATLELLARIAVSHVRAGADVVAPSDMMDGRVGAIRAALDDEGFSQTPILAYSAKFASAFYGPFRDAAGSTPSFGDRRSYQMDPANSREAVREALLDAAEGADMVMVKPALAYGDLIRAVRRATRLPIAVYNVSGEYAMVKAAAAAGYLDERATVMEILISLRRAGADVIISYHAKDAALWLAE